MPLRDLSGMKFGSLSVVERAANVDGRTAWLCKCECGSSIVAKSRNLTSGRQTSCGCQWKKKGIEQLHYIEGTCLEMIQSKTVRCNSKSGVTGVFYDQSKDRWRAEIMFQGKRHYLGRFRTEQEAVDARKQAEIQMHEPFLMKYEKQQTR